MFPVGRSLITVTILAALAAVTWGVAGAGPGHSGPHGDSAEETLENLREMHRGHEHEHDFQAIDRLSPEERTQLLGLMRDIGLALPPMDAHRGHQLFIDKGCILCHQVNGIGGEVGPPINAKDMPSPMNVFEFAARMWKGSPAMVALQEEEFGEVIQLSGQDLADLIAFAHDERMQATVSLIQIPEKWRDKIAH